MPIQIEKTKFFGLSYIFYLNGTVCVYTLKLENGFK